jgi:glutamate dehydrogenase
MPDQIADTIQPPTVAVTDPVREELLAQAEAALALRLGRRDDAAAAFLHHWAKGLRTTELAALAAEDIAGAALSLWDFAQARTPGKAKVRVFNPGGREDGWRSHFAVAEIVNDDMPFLVDTALAAFELLELPVHSLLHPILPVHRDEQGRLTGIGAGGAPESIMQVAFGPQGDPAGLAQTEAALARGMADVRAAVADFGPLVARLEEVRTSLPRGSEHDFLAWVAQDNFILLGYRRLVIGPALKLAPDTASELGLLRDPSLAVFDALRDPASARAAVQAALANPGRVAVAKSDMRSTVRRPQLCDVIGVKELTPQGGVVALHLFLGLFGTDAYNRNPRSIPMLADKVQAILARSGTNPKAHDGRVLRHIVDTWPRDDLFQGSESEILQAARRVMELQIRPELALFVRRELLGRRVSAIVYLPRDHYDTRMRQELAGMLTRAFEATLVSYAMAVGDGPLARVQFLIATDPASARQVDVAGLEGAMAQAARSFSDRLGDALASEQGEAQAARTVSVWGSAFPAEYAARHTAGAAVHDIRKAETAIAGNCLTLALLRPFGAGKNRIALKLYRPGEAVPLSNIVPLIETLGLRVIEEVPTPLVPNGRSRVSLQTLTLESADGAPIDLDTRGGDLLATLEAVWDGRADADGFNRLVLGAGISWRDAWLLRAMFKWCRQVGFPFSQAAAETALSEHPRAARVLVDLFHRRFDPMLKRDAEAEARLDAEWTELLDAIESPDEDRILRRLRNLLDAVLRTNFYQAGMDGTRALALKIDSAHAGDMPLPRPWREIWVHNARMEGCHLRGGPVARGGIRWSDRREDFRTEILGLMKAQMVKNVVIVPVGSKGGFVLKQAPAPTGDAARDREAFQAEGVACYRLLVNGLLDATDTLRLGKVVPPDAVVRRDGDDPYLVVAADKGTATFSDIANGIAVERGFWLGDAFASGGSIGYDHKAMGITAKGAWVNVARHFREMGRDIQRDEFTCVGVGDMSGDVFGNGLLVSPKTKLFAAFDHRHIFIDPAPDPAASYAERARLFALPRSSWADYNPAHISAGGGVYPRGAKSIALSAQAAAVLELHEGAHEPAAIMRAILKAEVDLLYFGGIGTYVKASTQSQADAGDRANDPIRTDAAALRAKVVGEGANLAVTQPGRIEAALGGVRINTDALDNSAGVDTSDHEVNIKILVADAVESGRLTEQQRVQLLASMTDEVGAHVLRDNHQQSQAISLDLLAGARDLPAQNALMGVLERAGVLDRTVAGLPDAGAVARRVASGQGLTRPELCEVMAHGKLWLSAAIDGSDLPDDPALEAELVGYFPAVLGERFPAEIRRHRLRRELIGTAVTNDLLNRLGHAAFGRLLTDSGLSAGVVAKAALVARDAFGLPAVWAAVEALDGTVPTDAQYAVESAMRRLYEATARALLAAPEALGGIAEAVSALRPGLAALAEQASARSGSSPIAVGLAAQGVPSHLASLVAALPALMAAPAIVQLAASAKRDVDVAASAWAGTGDSFGIETLRATVAAIPPSGAWGARAVAALDDDLAGLQARLAAQVLALGVTGAALLDRCGPAGGRAVALAREAAAMPDLAAATVAVRALHGVLPASP